LNILLDNLVAALSRLPGIGRRTAERMAYMLVEDQRGLKRLLANALLEADEGIVCCERCGAITMASENPCRICTGHREEAQVLCVVEASSDILKIESSGGFKGRYHALMGRLSPIQGVGAADLRVESLLERLQPEGITEVLLALGTDVESEATAHYLAELLEPRGIRLSRMASGLPSGSAIEYTDAATLAKAIEGRQSFS